MATDLKVLAFLGIFFFSSVEISSQTVEVLNKQSFLREVLGAKYSAKTRRWTLGASSPVLRHFEDAGEDGLTVQLDSILLRKVGAQQEAWVAYRVDDYMFNFTRLRRSPDGWNLQQARYHLHDGAPGEYSCELYGFQMVGRKTFLRIVELWYAMGITSAQMHLYDPFSGKRLGTFDLGSAGGKEQDEDAYLEYETTKIDFPAGPKGTPDVVLYQACAEKKPGKKARTFQRTLRYRFDGKTWGPV